MIAEPVLMSLATSEGAAWWFNGSLNIIKATTASTGGAFAMIHQTAAPGNATPYHLHHDEDEAFYVLDGEFTFFSDGRKIALGPATSSCRANGRTASAAPAPRPPACSSSPLLAAASSACSPKPESRQKSSRCPSPRPPMSPASPRPARNTASRSSARCPINLLRAPQWSAPVPRHVTACGTVPCFERTRLQPCRK